MTCTVVMPVHNHAALTARCLEELLARPDEALAEIVVVDDGSTDSTPALLEQRGRDVHVVRHDSNMGYASSCNDGAAVAACEWVVLLNNDTIPQQGWLDNLVRYASARERVGVVGSKLLFPDDTIQHAGVVFDRDLTPQHIYVGFPADHPAVATSREFQAVTGACLLIRRGLFQELGGFDTAFWNIYEDIDLCLRLRRHGYEVHYCHESVLYHLESATRDPDPDHRSIELFLERWQGFVYQDDIRYYAEDGLIEITYSGQFPVIVGVSPRLAVLHRERRDAAERLLAERSRQVYETLKENTRLRVELLDANQRADAASLASPGHGSAADGARQAGRHGADAGRRADTADP
jgi:GT2 family glycosyltransferase